MQSGESFQARLSEARNGDVDSLNSLIDTWRPMARIQARGLLGKGLTARSDSSDVVQETMLQVCQDLHKFRGTTEGEWMAWLRAILLAKAKKTLAFHYAKKRSISREGDIPAVDVEGEAPHSLSKVDDERLGQLAAALEMLPEAMREVIHRRVFLKQPFSEVSIAIGRTPGATRVLWTRAIRRLQQTVDAQSSK